MEHHAHKHSAGHTHHHTHHGNSSGIATAFFLNAAFTVIEIAGGLFTNSIAIISDALHDLGDTFSLGLAWYAEKLAKRSPDSRFTYGYKRFPVLAAMANAVFLVAASVFVLTRAIPLIADPVEVNENGMLWLAVLGIIFNGAAVLRLKGGSSINQRVVRLHLLEDTLGWIAVLIGAMVMKFTYAPWIDPLLGILIAAFILFNAIRNLKDSLKIILQTFPEESLRKKVDDGLKKISGLDSYHDVRTWSIDGNAHVYTLHVVTTSGVQASEYPRIKQEVRETLAGLGFEYITIEIDSFDEHCVLNNHS